MTLGQSIDDSTLCWFKKTSIIGISAKHSRQPQQYVNTVFANGYFFIRCHFRQSLCPSYPRHTKLTLAFEEQTITTMSHQEKLAEKMWSLIFYKFQEMPPPPSHEMNGDIPNSSKTVNIHKINIFYQV